MIVASTLSVRFSFCCLYIYILVQRWLLFPYHWFLWPTPISSVDLCFRSDSITTMKVKLLSTMHSRELDDASILHALWYHSDIWLCRYDSVCYAVDAFRFAASRQFLFFSFCLSFIDLHYKWITSVSSAVCFLAFNKYSQLLPWNVLNANVKCFGGISTVLTIPFRTSLGRLSFAIKW